jgi:hypothetical protein
MAGMHNASTSALTRYYAPPSIGTHDIEVAPELAMNAQEAARLGRALSLRLAPAEDLDLGEPS